MWFIYQVRNRKARLNCNDLCLDKSFQRKTKWHNHSKAFPSPPLHLIFQFPTVFPAVIDAHFLRWMFCVAFSVSSWTNFPQNWNTSKALSHSASSSGKLGFEGRGCLFFLPNAECIQAEEKALQLAGWYRCCQKVKHRSKVVIEMHLFLHAAYLSQVFPSSALSRIHPSENCKFPMLNRRKWPHQNNASSRKFTSDQPISGQPERAITSTAETI